MHITDDQKKALIVVGAVAVIAIAWYLTQGASAVPPGATGLQDAPASASGPLYTNYNVPPAGQQAASTIYPTPANDSGNGCCSGNDGCFTAGGINTGNAPTSLAQLMNWYAATPAGQTFVSAFGNTMTAFEAAPETISDQAAPAVQQSNTIF